MPSRSFSWPVIAGRILLVALAATAAVAAFVISRSDVADSRAPGPARFACPMHPTVTSSAPGDCSICRMALEPISPSGNKSSLSLPSRAEFRAFDAVSRTKPFGLSLEMRAHASIETPRSGTALFFRDESLLLAAGEKGTFSSTAPGHDRAAADIEVVVSAEPRVDWDRRTVLIRFDIVGRELEPGETGAVKFAQRTRQGLVVRAASILNTPEGPQVFVVSADRRSAVRRRIEIGNVIYGYAAVVSGLVEDEYVAARNVFALDVDFRSQGGL